MRLETGRLFGEQQHHPVWSRGGRQVTLQRWALPAPGMGTAMQGKEDTWGQGTSAGQMWSSSPAKEPDPQSVISVIQEAQWG